MSRNDAFAALFRLWSSARNHGDLVGDDLWLEHSSLSDLDDIGGLNGLGSAMEKVGWARVETSKTGISLPKFREFNFPKSNVERCQEWREKNRRANDAQTTRSTSPLLYSTDPVRPSSNKPIRSDSGRTGSNSLVGPDSAPKTLEAFTDRVTVAVLNALKLSSNQRTTQRRPIGAVARRIWRLEDRLKQAALAVNLAKEKAGAGLDNPVAAWQAEANRLWPKEER